MKPSIGMQLCLLAAGGFSGGCPAGDQQQSADPRSREAAARPATVPARQSDAQRLKDLVEQSRHDLASKLGVDATEIGVLEARHVMWPDGSAGCPSQGYEYMQMQTEGILIRLQADGRVFQYHAGAAGPAVHCEKPSANDPPSKFEER